MTSTTVPDGIYNLALLTDEDLDDAFDTPGEGVYFLPARTGKGWFHKAVSKSSAVCFLRGDNGNFVLVSIGSRFADIMEGHKYLGFLVRTKRED